MTSLEQSRHMCHMSQGIFEAQAKLFERRGLGFEDETWSNGFQQLDKVKVSFVNKREFNWLTAVCLICRFLRVGEMLQSTVTQFIRRMSVTNSMAKVHPSEGHQAELNGNIGFWGRISEGALQVSTFLGDVNYPISSTGLIPCGSCTEVDGKNIRLF